MPRICYTSKAFRDDALATIARAETNITSYQEQGYDLTLRQLYYQFVSRDWLPNTMASYKKLGDVINDARLAGLIDWNAIEDRTRNVGISSHWSSPRDIIRACASQYRVDRWQGQPEYVEVWVEKEALFGVIQIPCIELDVPRFACRGYVSQSEMWAAAQRFRHACTGSTLWRQGTIIHLGDHDPSGIDMSRDIESRMNLFAGGGDSEEPEFEIHVERIALNMDQVRQYNPPPNPAKTTDSRFESYIAQYGTDSWELDALEPAVIDNLVREAIERHLDRDLWEDREQLEIEESATLRRVSDQWLRVCAFVERNNT